MRTIYLNLMLMSIVVLLSGCFASPVRYYSLQDGQLLPLATRQSAAANSVGVSLVGLPKLLNRPQLVVRVSNSEVRFEEQHQWGGRLQEEVTQLLVSALQAAHPQQAVYLYPADNRAVPQQQWSAEIVQLDGVLGGDVSLKAQCRLLDKSSRAPLFERSIQKTIQTQGTQMTDYVDAQRELIKQLATACAW